MQKHHVLGLAALVCAGACRSEKESAPRPAPKKVESGPPGVVARVGDVEIRESVFETKLDEVLQRYARADKELRPALLDSLKSNLLRQLVEAELIRQKAVELDVEPSPESLEAGWLEHRAQYGADEGFERFLDRSGATEEGLRRSFVHNQRREAVFAKVVEGVRPSAEEVRTYYDERLEHFREPEQVKIAQILTRVPPGADRAPYRERAEKLLESIRGGTSFDDAARAFSEDASARTGELSWLGRNRMVSEVADAAFDELEDGQVSGVIESSFGFHVIKRVAKRPARTIPFQEARARIEQRMTSQRRNKAMREALESWKDEAEIELFREGNIDRTTQSLGIGVPAPMPIPTVENLKAGREAVLPEGVAPRLELRRSEEP